MTIRALTIVVLVMIACRPSERPLSEAERNALADSLSGFAGQMVAEIDRHEVDRFIGHHENVPGFAWASSAELIELDSMHASMRSYFGGPEGREVHFSLGEVRAYPLGRNAGVVTGIIHSTNRDSLGAEQRGSQAWSIVVERRGGDWKVVQVHESYPRTPR
jgi:hypothetical protein